MCGSSVPLRAGLIWKACRWGPFDMQIPEPTGAVQGPQTENPMSHLAPKTPKSSVFWEKFDWVPKGDSWNFPRSEIIYYEFAGLFQGNFPDRVWLHCGQRPISEGGGGWVKGEETFLRMTFYRRESTVACWQQSTIWCYQMGIQGSFLTRSFRKGILNLFRGAISMGWGRWEMNTYVWSGSERCAMRCHSLDTQVMRLVRA